MAKGGPPPPFALFAAALGDIGRTAQVRVRGTSPCGFAAARFIPICADMTLLHRLFGKTDDPRAAYRPLYEAIVARGRTPAWYLDGAPDTIDGRFDVITAVLAHVLIRLEADPVAKQPSVYLAELFVDDMDGQLRQSGIGDIVVGKHIGKMMGALGGRLTAYRDAAGEAGRLRAALVRNVWRSDDPGQPADAVAARMAAFAAALEATPIDSLLSGQVPAVPA